MRIEPADAVDFDWAQDEVAPEWNRLTDAEGVVALVPTPIHENVRVGMAVHRDGELTWLFVEQWERRKGIGTALLDAIPGPLRVTITNADLFELRFFQRRGFRIVGADVLAHGWSTDVVNGIKVRDDIHLTRAG